MRENGGQCTGTAVRGKDAAPTPEYFHRAIACGSCPLSRYSGGGLGRGFLISDFRSQMRKRPHPCPPPEYREREESSRILSGVALPRITVDQYHQMIRLGLLWESAQT